MLITNIWKMKNVLLYFHEQINDDDDVVDMYIS